MKNPMKNPTEIEQVMNRNTLHVLHSASLALLLTLAVIGRDAQAAEAGGLIEGVLGDRQFSVEMDPNQSDWYGDGNSGGVALVSRPIAPSDGLGRLSIGFEGSDFRAGRFSNFEVDLFVRDAPGSGYGATLDDGLDVSIDRIEAQDGVLQIEARVRGTLNARHSGADGDTRDLELTLSVRIGNPY
jgi:hypothetical protein